MLPAKIFVPTKSNSASNLCQKINLTTCSNKMEINLEQFYNKTRTGGSTVEIDFESEVPEAATVSRD